MKNKLVAALLAIFLGGLGIHDFYLGRNTKGIIFLLCGTLGWILFLPPVIVSIWAFVEGIMFLVMSDAEFDATFNNGVSSTSTATTFQNSPTQALKDLSELMEKGMITPEEFEKKKAELLSQI
jgi:TM2 domain-containing membrane protein YozV